MSEQNNTALVAIVIAVIAFVVTTAQLVQALFGTAEGYRRCQASVIGTWANETHRVWRWSEFRYKTVFETPHIYLQSTDDKCMFTPFNEESANSHTPAFLSGDEDSRRSTHSEISFREKGATSKPIDRTPYPRNADLVSWLKLLDRLHQLQERCFDIDLTGEGFNRRCVKYYNQTPEAACPILCPAVAFCRRSWDFMPPDIVRPFASSTVETIIALAHRLGMEWKELRPGEGIMRAEGGGHSLVSTSVRGLGIFLRFTSDQAIVDKIDREAWRSRAIPCYLTIPSKAADKFGFGIIPCFRGLNLPDEDIFMTGVDPVDAMDTAMGRFDVSEDAIKTWRTKTLSSRRFVLADLASLIPPFMPISRSSIIQVIYPHERLGDSPLRWMEGFRVFRKRLEDLSTQANSLSKQMNLLLAAYYDMSEKHGRVWKMSVNSGTRNPVGVEFLEDLRKYWSWTTKYFHKLEYPCLVGGEAVKSTFRYRDLVGAHTAQAVSKHCRSYSEEAQRKYIAGHRGVNHQRNAKLMHFYIERIPSVIEPMQDKGFGDERVVVDAWWTMMFRGMCWNRSVWDRPNSKVANVPSNLYGSSIPLYIA